MKSIILKMGFAILAFGMGTMGLTHISPSVKSATTSEFQLSDALEHFGIVSAEQKEAFLFICKEAGIVIEDKFDFGASLRLVDSTQEHFVNRSDKQERWENVPLQWMEQNPKEVLRCLKTLGYIDCVKPEEQVYDVVCILGARKSSMQCRLEYFQKLLSEGMQTPTIGLLTGERYAVDGVDGTPEELLCIAEEFGIPRNNLTETHLFKFLYNHSSLKDKFKLVIIDTPQQNGFRPTTQTTVIKFSEWLQLNKDVQRVLFISEQPHVKYQGAVISEVLHQQDVSLKVEVVGDDCFNIDVQKVIGAVGSYIWVNTPGCLRDMGIVTDSQYLDMLEKLYSHQPWIYNSFQNNV